MTSSSTQKKKFNWKIWAPVIGSVLLLGFILNLTGYQSPQEIEREEQAQVAAEQAVADQQAADEKKAEREAVAAEKKAEREAEKAAKDAEKEKADAERAAREAAYLSDAELAAQVEKNWLDGLGGLESFQERLGKSDTLIGYISQINPIDSRTVRVTVQLPSGGLSRDEKKELKKELKTVAQGCLNIGGFDFPQLQRCEVETADVDMIESMSR